MRYLLSIVRLIHFDKFEHNIDLNVFDNFQFSSYSINSSVNKLFGNVKTMTCALSQHEPKRINGITIKCIDQISYLICNHERLIYVCICFIIISFQDHEKNVCMYISKKSRMYVAQLHLKSVSIFNI